MNTLKYIIVFAFLMLTNQMWAQITPMEAIEQMGRGINLGNTLEAPKEGEWASKAQEHFFDDYKTEGFSTIRIPVRWYPYTAEQAPYKIEESWMDRVEEVLDWGLAQDFYIILNIHHSSPIKEDYNGQIARYEAIWTQIVDRFKGKSERLFYEMINEPKGFTQAQINDFNERILKIIRQENAQRIVIFGGHEWSNSAELITPNLIIPDDDYVMGYFHSYDPWSFAGEGTGTWGTESDKAELQNKFEGVANWSSQNNVPVFLGEFGATNVDSDLNSRYRHYAAYVKNCLVHNMAFAVWDDGGWFEIYNRNARSWNEFKDIVLHYSPQSPTNIEAESTSEGDVYLKWLNSYSDYQKLVIQRKKASEDYINLIELAADQEEYLDEEAGEGVHYHYRVLAHRKDTAITYSYPQYIYAKKLVRKPFNNWPLSIPGTIEAEEFDDGGEGLSYHDTDMGNTGEAFRTDVDVDIEKRDDGAYHVGWIEDGEWLEYSVSVDENAEYRIELHVAAMEAGGKVKLKVGPNESDVLDVPSTNSWQTTTQLVTLMNLDKGDHILRLQFPKGGFNLDKLKVSYSDVGILSNSALSFNIYPNPGTDFVNIDGVEANAIQTMDIYDVGGQKVKSIHSYTPVNISSLKNGMYYIHITDNQGKVYVSKFLKK